MSWKPARIATSRAVYRWLKNDEWKHVALSTRLKEAGSVARFGQIGGGRLWTREDDGIVEGAVFISRWGVLLPAFEPGQTTLPEKTFLTRLLRTKRTSLYSMIGTDERIRYLENLLGETPDDWEAYRILTAASFAGVIENHLEGIRIHQAEPSDRETLWPLEKAYQIEEVIRGGSSINEPSCRRLLHQTLRHQLVFYVTKNGKPIAKANTNARGILYDQIGGVYVVPELRNQGIAAALIRRLLGAINSEGRRACLFVKESNAPALRLYEK